MALFNYATKEITLKIVYYGPGLSGKTTNLQHLHSVLNTASKGKLLSLSTEADRTLFFDFLPVELGKIRDFSIRFQLYTVPGQVRYNATRRIVLKGADAVVFVADSQRAMREQNIESFDNMRENLSANNINPDEIPVIFQYNKRDLKDIAALEELNQDLNSRNYPFIEGIAINGTGVEEAFRLISRLLLQHISKKHKIEVEPVEKKETPTPPPVFQEKVSKAEDLEAPVVFPDRPFYEERSRPLDRQDESVFERQSLRSKFIPSGERSGSPGAASESAPVSRESIEKIIREVEGIHAILKSMQASVSAMSNEMKALSEIRKSLGETNSYLRNFRDLFARTKKGKRWFKF